MYYISIYYKYKNTDSGKTGTQTVSKIAIKNK